MIDLNNRYDIIVESIAIRGNLAFCVARDLNVMFKINLETLEVETILDMPDENMLIERLFNGICIENDKMILIPYNASKFWIYDFKCEKWIGVDISNYVAPEMTAKFVGGGLINGKACLFGFKYRGILVVDTDTLEITELLQETSKQGEPFWGQSSVIIDEKIYVASRIRNEVICINLSDISYEVFYLEGCEAIDGFTIAGIAYDGEKFFITSHHGNYFYEWCPNHRVKKMLIDEFYNSKECFFNGVAVSDEKVFLFSPKGKSYVYDRKDAIKSYIYPERVYYAKYVENMGVIITQAGKIIIDFFSNEQKEISVMVDEKVHSQYIKRVSCKNELLKERKIIGLKEFLTILTKETKN